MVFMLETNENKQKGQTIKKSHLKCYFKGKYKQK